MRIAMAFVVLIHAGFGICQGPYLAAGGCQNLIIYLGAHLFANPPANLVGDGCFEQAGNQPGNTDKISFHKAALGQPGGAEAHTRGRERRPVARNGVTVGDNPGQIQDAGSQIAIQCGPLTAFERLAVDQTHVRIRTAIGHPDAFLLKCLRQGRGVAQSLTRHFFE